MNIPVTTCGKCRRPLSDPKSVERGYGPDCWASIQSEAQEHKKPFADAAAQSDYDYHVVTGQAMPVIVIEDLDRGGKSVTNNADAVYAAVLAEAGYGPGEAKVIYRDSDGCYDGLALSDGKVQFYPLRRVERVKSEAEAIASIKWAEQAATP